MSKVCDENGNSLIVSKKRVQDHGEVLTPPDVVNAMLNLVMQETERIESRFLEPACGTGNFLVEILRRKLDAVDRKYKRSQLEWERNAVVAVSAMYGIELLMDNTQACRERLIALFKERYASRFNDKIKPAVLTSVRFLVERNIICGNALDLKTVDDDPIIFSEWSPVNGSMLKRRDFAFHELSERDAVITNGTLATRQQRLFGEVQNGLFDKPKQPLMSDTGDSVFIAEPIKEFPLVHFLEVGDAGDR